jgi:hypothetical protein
MLERDRPAQVDEFSFLDDLQLELRNAVEGHGAVMTDADLRGKNDNPYRRLGLKLLADISKSRFEKEPNLLNIYLAMQKVLVELSQRERQPQTFNTLGLEKIIKKGMEKTERKDPSVKMKTLKDNASALKWHSYRVAIRLAIETLNPQADSLSKRGYLEESNELRRISAELSQLTKSYFELPKNQRIKKYEKYKTDMDAIGTSCLASNLFKQHRGLAQILQNILLTVCSLGFGLIWLKATENKRGSFWYRPDTQTLKVLKSVVENAQNFPKEEDSKDQAAKQPNH